MGGKPQKDSYNTKGRSLTEKKWLSNSAFTLIEFFVTLVTIILILLSDTSLVFFV